MSPTDLLSLIGHTPLVELPNLSPRPGIRLFAKLEGQNPSGSVKDRIALGLVEAAEKQGALRPGQGIIEASSGNTAIAAAMVGKQKGHPVKVVLPEGITPSVADILHLLGAEIIWCEPKAGLRGAIELACQLAEAEGLYPLGQFSNQANVLTHYHTTGPEITQALEEVDVFVAGIGTGGTVTGVGRWLKERDPRVKVIGIEPRMGERLQGLRSLAEGFLPPLLDLSLLDGKFLVDAASSIEMARRAARVEGLMAGVSSGACLQVALRMAERIPRGNIVVMFSDGGWKYLPAKPWDAARKGEIGLDEIHWW